MLALGKSALQLWTCKDGKIMEFKGLDMEILKIKCLSRWFLDQYRLYGL